MKKLLLIPLCLFLLFGTSLALAAEEPNCSVPNAVGHIVHGTTEYQSDASHHWLACTLCGARTGGWGEHTVSCDQPTVCLVCAANDLSVPYYHSVGNTYVTTETQHALLCLRCNQPCYWSNHAAYCHSENLCVSCGETVTSDMYENLFVEAASLDAQKKECENKLYELQDYTCCPQCGNKAQKGMSFCPKCGAPLQNTKES